MKEAIYERFDNTRIIQRALERGAVWECPHHPDVLIAHGEKCECGAVQK